MQLRVVCQVCGLLQQPANRTHNPQLRWAYRCPKHVELFKIINKFVHQVGTLVIFIYDARTHIHQIKLSLVNYPDGDFFLGNNFRVTVRSWTSYKKRIIVNLSGYNLVRRLEVYLMFDVSIKMLHYKEGTKIMTLISGKIIGSKKT